MLGRLRQKGVRDSANPRASPGETPEPEDADLVATLVQEAFEENQVRVGATAYLGYQEMQHPGRARYAQVRMAGVIEEFAPRTPDPDGGRVYRRLMTSLRAAQADNRRSSRTSPACRQQTTARTARDARPPYRPGSGDYTPRPRLRQVSDALCAQTKIVVRDALPTPSLVV